MSALENARKAMAHHADDGPLSDALHDLIRELDEAEAAVCRKIDSIAKRWYERPDLGFTRGWDGAPDDVQDEYRTITRHVIEAAGNVA